VPRDLKHRAAFESHGEVYVRKLSLQLDEVGREALAWLGEQQSLRDEAEAAKRDAREEETLAIAREALANSNRANNTAIISIVCSAAIAITAAVISMKVWLLFV
jgi:hypothetical protein